MKNNVFVYHLFEIDISENDMGEDRNNFLRYCWHPVDGHLLVCTLYGYGTLFVGFMVLFLVCTNVCMYVCMYTQ